MPPTIKTHTKDGKLLAHPQFYNSAGKRLASVTTIAKSVSGASDGLVYWANQAGLDGLTLEDARRLPADVGTFAHDAIEADLKSQPFDLAELHLPEDQHGLVVGAISEWQRWKAQCDFELVAAERPLVTEVYGGVIDCVAHINGKLSILDWKTGSGIYRDQLTQVASYGELWRTCTEYFVDGEPHIHEPAGYEIEEYHLVRLGKTDGSFHHHSWRRESPSVQDALKLWTLALEVYPLAQGLDKLVKG